MENIPGNPDPGPNPGPAKSLNRNILLGVMVVSLTVAGTSGVYLLVHQKSVLQNKTVAVESKKAEKDYVELKKKYDDLETDRNNVLAQTKNLLEEKAKWSQTEDQLESLRKTNRLFMTQKDKILSDNQKLKTDMAAILENFDSLKESYQELQAKQEAVEKEDASLRDLLTKQVQSTPEYQVLDREAKRLREENVKLGETINMLDARIKKALDRINKDQQREVSMVRQVQEQKRMLDTLRSQNTALGKGNQELNEVLTQAPDKIRDMAAQNTALVKETAEMHYNMGVFFTNNKEFERAEKEYIRALDFDPNNLKVHYNLGYLYAEDLNKQDKAVFHLEKYLQIDPNAKESEAVRSYITTLDVWNKGLSPKKR